MVILKLFKMPFFIDNHAALFTHVVKILLYTKKVILEYKMFENKGGKNERFRNRKDNNKKI